MGCCESQGIHFNLEKNEVHKMNFDAFDFNVLKREGIEEYGSGRLELGGHNSGPFSWLIKSK